MTPPQTSEEKILEEFAKKIEYHPSMDIGLNQVSLIKQEIGTVILAELHSIISQIQKEAHLEGYKQGRLKCLQQHDYGFIPQIQKETIKECREKVMEVKYMNHNPQRGCDCDKCLVSNDILEKLKDL